ncbi:hypothetical protein ACFRFU_02170 [Streptomyces sp. NPDC056704]|uniref:hypothetical protein n=1 Tax=Streptomyces sp. NPDC056704 TaxID=3345917 RepID=UPI0036BFE332
MGVLVPSITALATAGIAAWAQLYSADANTSASPRPAVSITSVPAESTSAATSPTAPTQPMVSQPSIPYDRGGCRGGIVVQNGATMNPCVYSVDGKLKISTNGESTGPGQVTIFLWLTDGNKHRPNVEPHRCDRTFKTAGEPYTCGPYWVTPDQSGKDWAAATAVAPLGKDYPDGWESFPSVAGTMSGHPQEWPQP